MWPLATLKWPTVALDIRKCGENKGKHQFGVLGKTVVPSSKKPQTVVETNGRWSRYHPPDDPPSQIGPPPPPASISARNCANLRTHSQIWHTLGSPFKNHRKSPRLPSGNVPASNAMRLDVQQGPHASRTSLLRNLWESTRFHAFLTRFHLVMGPHTSQLRVQHVLRYSGSISSQIRPFKHQDNCPVTWMTNHHPLLLLPCHFDPKWPPCVPEASQHRKQHESRC